MIEDHGKHGGNIVAVYEVPDSETHQYGIVGIESGNGGSMGITQMVEKPAKGTAPSNLAISGRYILSPEIFETPGDPGTRRGWRDPAHGCDDHAGQAPAFLRA